MTPNWASGPQNQPKANVADCRFSGTDWSIRGIIGVDVFANGCISDFRDSSRFRLLDGLRDDGDARANLTDNC